MRLVAAMLVAVLTTACAPGTPDDDSWRIDADRAVSDAASAVQAARLALEQSVDGRVMNRYLQTVLVEAEQAVSAAGDAISGVQPPRSERERYGAVTDQVSTAEDLVTEARIAVVDGEADRYDRLASDLADAADGLQALATALEHPQE